MKRLSLVAAFDNNRLIGADGKLPWDTIPADMARFRRLTLGKPVIMGRKTHESIGRALPDRRNIVISSLWSYNPIGCDTSPSLRHALTLVEHEDEAVIIGGASVYRQAFELTGIPMRMYLTRVNTSAEGDTYFPDFDPNQWEMIDHTWVPSSKESKYNLNFMTHAKRA